jgi:hypothetical protein
LLALSWKIRDFARTPVFEFLHAASDAVPVRRFLWTMDRLSTKVFPCCRRVTLASFPFRSRFTSAQSE